MRDVEVAKYEGSEITLSMVKWGAVRRSVRFLEKEFRLANPLCTPPFVPHYEIALFEGNPCRVLSKRPFIVFYYQEEAIARAKLEELIALVQQGRLLREPLLEFMHKGNPAEQGVVLDEDRLVHKAWSRLQS